MCNLINEVDDRWLDPYGEQQEKETVKRREDQRFLSRMFVILGCLFSFSAIVHDLVKQSFLS